MAFTSAVHLKEKVVPVAQLVFLAFVGATLWDSYSLTDRQKTFCGDMQESFNAAGQRFAAIAGLESEQLDTEKNSVEIAVTSPQMGGFIPWVRSQCHIDLPMFLK